MTPKKIHRFFRARTEADISNITIPPVGAAGGIAWDRDGKIIAGIPVEENAIARTVRVHEADHIRYTPKMPRWEIELRKKAIKLGITEPNIVTLCNGIEDARISTLPMWKDRPRAVRRDAAATVYRELRALVKARARYATALATMALEVRDTAKANEVNVLLRGIALGYMYGKVPSRLNNKIIYDAVLAIVAGNMRYATDIVLALCTPEKRPMPVMPGDGQFETAETDYDTDTWKDGKFLVRNNGNDSPLRIVTPPHDTPCDMNGDNSLIEDYASTGYRIRRSTLPQIALGIPQNAPFIRQRVTAPSGVILIDGSGSMNINHDKLRKLCQLAPAATVLYYSATNVQQTYLVIYAKDGKRMSDSLPMPNHYDGNGRDDLAMQYAIQSNQSSEPVTMITDCGWQNYNQSERICRQAIADGKLRLIGSYKEAIAVFQAVTA